MFQLIKPDNETIRTFLDSQKNAAFSYAEVGMSLSGSPLDGYNIDHNRIRIGSGPVDFQSAINAVKSWKMFDMPWVELCRPDTQIEVGSTVAILVRHFGFWSLNAARIVYVIEEERDIERFGFAYGTLTEHAERGEERFSVEFHHDSGEVWYDLFAFSKPNHVLARLGYSLSRRLQRRFAEESKQAILSALNGQTA